MNGFIPWGTSDLGYSDSMASFKPTGYGRYGRHGGVLPPSDESILPSPCHRHSVLYYSFSRIMTFTSVGVIIPLVGMRSTGYQTAILVALGDGLLRGPFFCVLIILKKE